jgi:hypothetical protein
MNNIKLLCTNKVQYAIVFGKNPKKVISRVFFWQKGTRPMPLIILIEKRNLIVFQIKLNLSASLQRKIVWRGKGMGSWRIGGALGPLCVSQ